MHIYGKKELGDFGLLFSKICVIFYVKVCDEIFIYTDNQ